MNPATFRQRRLLLASLLSTMVGGCLPVPASGPQPEGDAIPRDGEIGPKPSDAAERPPQQGLREALDRALDDGYRRVLTVADNGAWQVLHGVLAYGTECQLTVEDELVSATSYLLEGGQLAGWDPKPGDMVGDPSRRGVRFDLEIGSMTGQGHRDQWLAVLSQCPLPETTPLRIGDAVFTLEDALLQALWDVPRNVETEYSWTVIAVTAYRPTDFHWIARDAGQWSVERLVDSETRDSLTDAACGGTHRLIGLAMTVDRHRQQGGSFSGVWGAAEDRVAHSIAEAQRFQNGDGSFSTNYIERYGWSPDLADILRTTGHVLEFLAIACDDDQLRAPWIEAAVARLCGVLESTRHVDLECGALYHALHGLILYRQRRYPQQPWTAPHHSASNS